MNTIKLIQKHILCYNEYHLDYKFLLVEERSGFEIKKRKIRLENIGHKLKIEKENELLIWIVFIFIGITSFLLVIGNAIDHSNHFSTWAWILMSISSIWLTTLFFLTPKTSKITIVSGSELVEFMLDKPSENAVRAFVDETISRSKNLLIRKYRPDPDLPEEIVLHQLNWLRDREIISMDDFFNMKSDYYSKIYRVNPD